jgi:RNA-directed DNA polymerase
VQLLRVVTLCCGPGGSDFQRCSYGFRPNRRVLALVKAFLKAGILCQDGARRDTDTGDSARGHSLRCWPTSPCRSWTSTLPRSLALQPPRIPGAPATKEWGRRKRRQRGQANYRLIRHADDFLVMVSGDGEHAALARETVAAVLAPMGLRLSDAKTMITHIEAGLNSLGWSFQRHRKQGTTRHYAYTYPAKKPSRRSRPRSRRRAEQTSTDHCQLCCTDLTRCCAAGAPNFRPGVSSSTFQYLSKIAWYQVAKWIRRKHRRMTGKELRRRYCGGGWWPTRATGQLFDPGRVRVTRYRYRGTAIPTRWTTAT